MTTFEKVVLGTTIASAVGLWLMSATAPQISDSISSGVTVATGERSDLGASLARSGGKVSLAAVSPQELQTFDKLGLTDDERQGVVRALSVERANVLAIWGQVTDQNRMASMLRLRDVMLAAEADLRSVLGDKYPSWEQMRLERMGMAIRPDGSTD